MITTIYVVTNKEVKYVNYSYYKYIQGGSANNRHIDGLLHDSDHKDNLADINPHICEFSSYYQIYKYDNESEIIGTSHYRRFFDNGSLWIKPITDKKINKILKKKDVILPIHETMKSSIREQYCKWHRKEDLDILLRCLEEYDSKFYAFYQKYLDRVGGASMRAMFICKRDIAMKFFSWIFPVLIEVESKIDYSNRTLDEVRAPGFLAERLVEAWMIYNGYNIKYHYVYNTDYKGNWLGRIKHYIKNIMIQIGLREN